MMSMMMLRPRGAFGAALALGALAAAGALSPALAQEVRPRVRVERDDCRCVDREGKPIENCTCFTMPDVDRIVTRALSAVVARPRLGITLSGEEADDALGARVESVMEDGPADEAGIREGDIITRLDGKNLLEPLGSDVERRLDEDGSLPVQRLMALVRQIEPGQEVPVEFLRDGERRTVTLEARELDQWSFSFTTPEHLGGALEGRNWSLRTPRGLDQLRLWSDSGSAPRIITGAAPDMRTFMFRSGEDGILRTCPASGNAERPYIAFSGGCIGGLHLVELNPGLADYFGASSGVLVADVHEDSAMGVTPGDVIVGVGDREVTDPAQARRILSSYSADEPVTLRILRQKREMSVQGRLGR